MGEGSYPWSRFMVGCPILISLAARVKDHLNLRNPLTAVAEHYAHEHHKITKDSVKLLAREDVWLKRKVREAIKIKVGQPAMNRDQGYELPPPASTMNYCCHVITINDLGGLASRPEEECKMPVKACHQAKQRL